MRSATEVWLVDRATEKLQDIESMLIEYHKDTTTVIAAVEI